MRQAGGVRPSAMRCHASVAHNQILNGASVIFSPFIGVQLTSCKARTQSQLIAVFDPNAKSAMAALCHGRPRDLPIRLCPMASFQLLALSGHEDCDRTPRRRVALALDVKGADW